VPDYYQVIETPIDLSVIKRRIEDFRYYRFSEVERDFKLLVNNCEKYNGPKNGYTQMAYTIWKVFKRSAKRFLKHDLMLDESEAFLYPRKKQNPKSDNSSCKDGENGESGTIINLNEESPLIEANLDEKEPLNQNGYFMTLLPSTKLTVPTIVSSSNLSPSKSQNEPAAHFKKALIKSANSIQSPINVAAVSITPLITNGVHEAGIQGAANVQGVNQKVLKFKVFSPNNLKMNTVPSNTTNVQSRPASFAKGNDNFF